MSATPQLPLGRSAMKLRRTQIAGGMMVCRLPRRDRRASAPADARDPCRPHQPSGIRFRPASREAIGLQLGP